jgi:signal peptidase II
VGLIVGVSALVIVVDQLTKTLALEHLVYGVPDHVIGSANWVLTLNKGAAFTVGAGVGPIVEAVVVVLIAGLVVASRRASRGARRPVLLGLGLLVGGALSNLGDRLFRHHGGAVVDFIQLVHWWPIFNVADAAITVGAVLVVLGWAGSPQRGPSAAGSGPSS